MPKGCGPSRYGVVGRQALRAKRRRSGPTQELFEVSTLVSVELGVEQEALDVPTFFDVTHHLLAVDRRMPFDLESDPDSIEHIVEAELDRASGASRYLVFLLVDVVFFAHESAKGFDGPSVYRVQQLASETDAEGRDVERVMAIHRDIHQIHVDLSRQTQRAARDDHAGHVGLAYPLDIFDGPRDLVRKTTFFKERQ